MQKQSRNSNNKRNSKRPGKSVGKKQKLIMAGIAAVILLAAIVIIVLVIVRNDKKDSENEQRYLLGDGIVIEKASSYSGEFWEDGSDKEVKDIWQLTVTNTSDEDVQYLKILADADGETAEFDITTLTAGSTVNVLESSAKAYPDNEQDCTYNIENLARFSQERSLHDDIFTVSVADNWIKVENHSEQDIENDIYVYYKNVEEDDIYRGGITYRIKIEGGLKAGESKEKQTQHFILETSKIMNLTYE